MFLRRRNHRISIRLLLNVIQHVLEKSNQDEYESSSLLTPSTGNHSYKTCLLLSHDCEYGPAYVFDPTKTLLTLYTSEVPEGRVFAPSEFGKCSGSCTFLSVVPSLRLLFGLFSLHLSICEIGKERRVLKCKEK